MKGNVKEENYMRGSLFAILRFFKHLYYFSMTLLVIKHLYYSKTGFSLILCKLYHT